MIKPGLFSKIVCADNRRMDFDFGNEQLLFLNKQIDVLFIGDSITQLWDINAYINTPLFIVNRAIGGDDSIYLLKRFDADCIQLKPKKCILMIGTNDISLCHYDYWWKEEGKNTYEVFKDYKANILQIIKKCQNAEIELILCSVIPSDIAPPFNKEMRFNMTQKINNFLFSCANKNNLSYIDYFYLLCKDDKKTIKPEYTLDGIHPNAKCYGVMAKLLKEYI